MAIQSIYFGIDKLNDKKLRYFFVLSAIIRAWPGSSIPENVFSYHTQINYNNLLNI
jgi:hypothetical protein